MVRHSVAIVFTVLACTAVGACGSSTVAGTAAGGKGGATGGGAGRSASGGSVGFGTGGVGTGGQTSSGTGGSLATDGGAAPTPGGSVTMIACGSTQCSISTQTCCISPNGDTAMCVTGTDCGAGVDGGQQGELPTGLKCSGASNCAQGTVCCVSAVGNGPVSSSCSPTCPATGAQLCNPAAGTSGCAGDAGACSSTNIGDWGLPATFGTCGGIGM